MFLSYIKDLPFVIKEKIVPFADDTTDLINPTQPNVRLGYIFKCYKWFLKIIIGQLEISCKLTHSRLFGIFLEYP